jgi:hypothetical protein
VKTEHAGSGELVLVGVFGPVPIEALESVALDADGRLAMTFSRRGLLGRRGDVALARVVESGRLVRCDIAHPPDRVNRPGPALISRVWDEPNATGERI